MVTSLVRLSCAEAWSGRPVIAPGTLPRLVPSLRGWDGRGEIRDADQGRIRGARNGEEPDRVEDRGGDGHGERHREVKRTEYGVDCSARRTDRKRPFEDIVF